MLSFQHVINIKIIHSLLKKMFAIQQKPTQHCKAIILPLNFLKNSLKNKKREFKMIGH